MDATLQKYYYDFSCSGARERKGEQESRGAGELERGAGSRGITEGTEVSINNPKLSTLMLERQQNAINNERKHRARWNGWQPGSGASVSSRFRMI